MERSRMRLMSMAVLTGCVVTMALLVTGCTGSKTTTAQTEAKSSTPAPPPPVVKQEMEAPAAAPPVDPMAWAGNLNDVYFEYDRSAISKSEYGTLNTVGKVLKEDGARKILVEGHCDARGGSAYNMVLGEKRARAVQSYLQNLGVAASQLAITSYGKERPICREDDESCYHRNRRAHFSAQ